MRTKKERNQDSQVTIRIAKPILDKIKQDAKEQRRSVSNYLRLLLEKEKL